MNKEDVVDFLFTIAQEVQYSFTSPVIYLTQKDFAENIFIAYRSMHNAFLQEHSPEKIADIINTFHIRWLEAVLDVEAFSRRIKETPREIVLQAIDYTKDCIKLRYDHTLEYMKKLRYTMTEDEYRSMLIELKVTKDLQDTLQNALLEKKQYIVSLADQGEYFARIHDETEELLHWLDKLDDNLAIELSKILTFQVPLTPNTLAFTLKKIINEVASNTGPEARGVAELVHVRSQLASSDHMEKHYEEEIEEIIDKIRALETRISRLKDKDSPALLALKHKTIFLEERLLSLENSQITMKKLRKDYPDEDSDDHGSEDKRITIFNHLLPHLDRCRLVDQLIQIWNNALMVTERDNESIIDILSVANVKEVYSDDIGNFTVDKFGRKIYKRGDEGLLYQLNEQNNLVPLLDDEKHVYFYDSCGRYYMNAKRERVYKHHDGASEYMLNKDGVLVKVLEEKEGREYFYDRLGRYYVNDEGRNIYREEDSTEEYEQDGLGNLVKIHEDPFCFVSCPTGPITTEENKYLKREVGDALKKCIAEVILHQPTDPIAYLADILTKYSDNIKAHQKHLKDEQERLELSQPIHTTKDISVNPSYVDEATNDTNYINYQHDTDLSVTSF
ncbi:hypothetical protein PYW07_003813 [Mythimna separata]|uniref:Uncharacterized protein n=1 Tax=Mythimna separata TaxID=271217 RepID=A0AAD7YNX5_MYTSE|nr:hypothetical protein PYW07_003813 [Mythimna separata]